MKGFKQGAQTHPGLTEAGEAMGFAKGGQVKKNPESPEFRMKTEKTGNPSDHGNMPKTEGDSEQEKEAGGREKVRPGYAEGGKVTDGYKKCNMGGKVCYKKGGKVYMLKGGKMVAAGARAATRAAKGATKAVKAGRRARNRVTGAKKSQGEEVTPVGRGSKNISK
jgi:hypothetical protein